MSPCIKAGTSERGACPACGKGWVRVVERSGGTIGRSWHNHQGDLQLGRRADNEAKGGHGYKREFVGWQPACSCGLPDGFKPDDFELIGTPTGERAGDDPSLTMGRAGYNRPRGPNEGKRRITRYEQRKYAGQLKDSPRRTEMQTEAGSAFDHYIRTGKSGARPIPPDLLEIWLERGWLEQVQVPEWTPLAPIPQIVLDPFIGSGTTALEADALGRNWFGIDIKPEYVEMTCGRIEKARRMGIQATLAI